MPDQEALPFVADIEGDERSKRRQVFLESPLLFEATREEQVFVICSSVASCTAGACSEHACVYRESQNVFGGCVRMLECGGLSCLAAGVILSSFLAGTEVVACGLHALVGAA